MTAFVAVLVLALTAAAAVWVRARLGESDAGWVELEAFRTRLGVPGDRFRIIDDGLKAGWRVRRAVPAFRQVHGRSRTARAAHGAAVRR